MISSRFSLRQRISFQVDSYMRQRGGGRYRKKSYSSPEGSCVSVQGSLLCKSLKQTVEGALIA